MNKAVSDYFRCPEEFTRFGKSAAVSAKNGFFTFGENTICYGRSCADKVCAQVDGALPNLIKNVERCQSEVCLPFDLNEIVDNLRNERYPLNSNGLAGKITERALSRKVYYLLRPLLLVGIRKHLQKVRLRGWEKIKFPHWPVDFTVENLMQSVLALTLKANKLKSVPFIWFWPDGAQSCAILTHDVEATAGRDFCGQLMDLDDSFGFKSAFQLVPEERYSTTDEFRDKFRARGFEINVHDLNHDGSLFSERDEFLRRAARINEYSKEFNSQGFRAGAMYRNEAWFDAFTFSYDMSVPNVAHMEPQRGGCCTVMPYFIGDIVELPLTAIQDYSLFHILGDYSITLWKRQLQLISERNGLISFIVHPDYLIEKRARDVYVELLAYLSQLRSEMKLWTPLPRQVDQWWRNRNNMTLVSQGGSWHIEGPDSHRATIAYAKLQGDDVVYTFDEQDDANKMATL